MLNTRLSSLLDDTELLASFHDASLRRLEINYADGTLIADFALCVGDPDGPDRSAKDRIRNGTLRLNGLAHWSIDPSTELIRRSGGIWLTADGPLADAPTEAGRSLAATFAGKRFGWWLFFSDLNAYGYVVADAATFSWET